MAYVEPKNRGSIESDLKLAAAQSIPTDGADDRSTNVLDFGNAAPRIGAGEKAYLRVKVTTLIAVASGTSSKLNINLTTASTATTVGGQTTVAQALLQLGYNDAKGKIYSALLPDKPVVPYQRFIAAVLEPVSDDTLYSAGAIDIWIDFD
jgi:hypothetical protein